MELDLSPEEVRVLGALIEKEYTTPEYYPLTELSLRNACNQKSNREPVVSYEEATVVLVLEQLRERELSRLNSAAGDRSRKHIHLVDIRLGTSREETAVLCVLMLRGPQTVGEIKQRSARMAAFEDTAKLQEVLLGLQHREPAPLVQQLPREPGRKEPRYAHLLSGEPDLAASQPLEQPAPHPILEQQESLAALTEEVSVLREEFGKLKQEFDIFKQQFE